MIKAFIGTGTVSHMVDETAPRLPGVPVERAPAVCNIRPMWPGQWLGTNGDSARAEELPLCRTCEMLLEDAANVGPA